ncbi:MAG: MFS transporter permease [Methanomicrobiaceae archaeon]|nr:MFS transporter permease [Methanomicrobiaceae archaeon]
MDWLGAISLIIGIMLIILGIGMTFSIDAITIIIEKFMGLLAILFGILLAAGGYMLVREQ